MELLKSGTKKLGLSLGHEQLEQFDIYYQELLEWNRRMNLTSITDYEEVQVKLFLDSLTVTLAFKQIIIDKSVRIIDVIFKGTESRKGFGRAEVKLILINEENILPIDFNEVEISRVIYSNGENEYYINKKRVRLKDIQELFYDTGIGKSAYSVMEQGKIDMILSNKPEDMK